MLLARQKIGFLNGGCDTCLTKERSMPVRAGEHVPSLTGYVGEKLYIDLVSMPETIKGNQYMLTVEDSFSRYCRAVDLQQSLKCLSARQHYLWTGFFLHPL